MSTLLTIEELTKDYGSTTAVDHLSLSVERGEIVGLLGANGAGKTTLMQMILGLLTPTSGEIILFGESFHKHRVKHLKRMNFTSTYSNLPSNLTVEQNLKFFAQIYAVKDAKRKIENLLQEFEIADHRKSITGNLSSGESTRLNLCKALLNDPELLLLDEPTASLDPDIADKVRTKVRQVADEKEITMLYTSHNMKDIETICDRLIFIHKGRIVTQGNPAKIVKQFERGSLEEVFIHLARDGEIVEETDNP